MKAFDMCVITKDVDDEIIKGSYAIILENYLVNNEHLVEVWNFKRFSGARIISISKEILRLATKEEILIFQKQFKKYCDDNQNGQIHS